MNGIWHVAKVRLGSRPVSVAVVCGIMLYPALTGCDFVFPWLGRSDYNCRSCHTNSETLAALTSADNPPGDDTGSG